MYFKSNIIFEVVNKYFVYELEYKLSKFIYIYIYYYIIFDNSISYNQEKNK